MSNGNQGIGSFLPSQYGTNLAAATQAQQENINQMMAANQAQVAAALAPQTPASTPLSYMDQLAAIPDAQEDISSYQKMLGMGMSDYGRHLGQLGERDYYRYIDVLSDPEYAQSLGFEDADVYDDFSNVAGYTGQFGTPLQAPTISDIINRDVSYQDAMRALGSYDQLGRDVGRYGTEYSPQYQNFEDYLSQSQQYTPEQISALDLPSSYGPLVTTPEGGWLAYAEQQAAELAAAQAAAEEEAANRPPPVWQTYFQQPYMSAQDVMEEVYGQEGYTGQQWGSINPQSPLHGINQPGLELYSALMQRPDLYNQLDPSALNSALYGNLQQYLPSGFGQTYGLGPAVPTGPGTANPEGYGESVGLSSVYANGGIVSLYGKS